MKVVCISDTHSSHRQVKVPDGDLLIFAGDYTRHDSFVDLPDFFDWMSYLPHRHKIFIPGNHDWIFERAEHAAREAVRKVELDKKQIKILIDQEITINGLKIYGSPWQPAFCDWAFNLPRNGLDLEEVWSHIPRSTDILITHGPPYGTLDITADSNRVGCELLEQRVKEVKPKLHIFGHIHEAYGHESNQHTIFVNASICDFHYNPVNKPQVFSI